METAFWADQFHVPLFVVHTLVGLSVSSLTHSKAIGVWAHLQEHFVAIEENRRGRLSRVHQIA
jgi:hypothetical protein